MSGDVEAEIAAVLAEHRPCDENLPWCSCGHRFGWDGTWSAHVADVLAPLLRDRAAALDPEGDA